MRILTTCFLYSNFLLRIIAILLVYIRHVFSDYKDDNNKCKFSCFLSYTIISIKCFNTNITLQNTSTMMIQAF